MSDSQLDLFGAADMPAAVGPASVPEPVARMAARLPAGLHLGTSSWTFPGWRGLVYDRATDQRTLAREGLHAYARHPLLRSVGIDRTYYGPLDAAAYRAYAAVVPDTFRFLAKAHRWCTATVLDGVANDLFLDAAYAADAVVAPFIEGTGSAAGVLLFQFPPQSVAAIGGADRFAERLYRFLADLPGSALYAVEIRNAALMNARYLDALEAAGAAHCFAVHPTMPPLARQIELAHARRFPAMVLRWNLHAGFSYEAARARYRPFDRLVDEDPETRRWAVDLCLRAAAARQPAFLIANNKAEGSAPLTLLRLAEALVA